MNDLTTPGPTGLAPAAPPMTVEEILAQRSVVVKVLRHIMAEGTHYGKIPGTQNKSLLKPGADMLLSTFHIATDPEIEDISGPQEIRYRVRLRGLTMGSGQLVGVGVGEASSNEEKYRWRKANSREYDATPENMRRVKYYTDNDVRQVRANPYDQVNTILKMAKKRASVDLVLTALAAAEIFDNIDETLRRAEAEERQRDAAPVNFDDVPSSRAETAQPRQDSAQSPAETGELNIGHVRKAADDAGLRDIDVLNSAGVNNWQDITGDKLAQAMTWIEENSP